jgi:nicotinic acid mononucleotide adenylyltransferase
VCQRTQHQTSNKEHIPTELKPFICNDLSVLRNTRSGKIFIANTDRFNISSTEIRDKNIVSENISEKLPQEIIDYIDQHQLYR